MERATGGGESADNSGVDSQRSAPTRSMLVTGLGLVARGVSFWSAVALPVVALGLIAMQPSWWLPALLAVFVLDAVALYLGHCHARGC